MTVRSSLRILAGVMVLLVAACTAEPAPTEPDETTTTAPGEPPPPEAVGALVVDQSFDVVTNDPHRQFETTGTLIHNAMYDTLMSFEGTDITRPVPWLAESMEINDDATEFTFVLRDDVVFSDGTPMTAEDVAFSYRRLQNVQGNPSFLLAGVTVETPDEMTVVLRTDEPNPALPFILTNSSTAIVNAEVVRANGGTDAEDASETDAAEAWFNGDAAGSGSGPYMLESYSDTTEIVMVANPNYWRTPPVWDRVVLRNADAAAQRLNIQSGEAHMVLDLAGDEIVGLPEALTIVTSPVPQTWRARRTRPRSPSRRPMAAARICMSMTSSAARSDASPMTRWRRCMASKRERLFRGFGATRIASRLTLYFSCQIMSLRV